MEPFSAFPHFHLTTWEVTTRCWASDHYLKEPSQLSSLLIHSARRLASQFVARMVIREVADGQAGLPVPNPTASYWHQSPSLKLLGHRTTAELPARADTVIIGSGLTGAFAAHFLKAGKARDEQLVMLEAREACWGATGRVCRYLILFMDWLI